MFTVPFSNIKTPKFIAQPTCLFLLLAIKCLQAAFSFRVHGDQIIKPSSDNGTVLGSSRKLGGALTHLIDGSEKLIRWLSFEF